MDYFHPVKELGHKALQDIIRLIQNEPYDLHQVKIDTTSGQVDLTLTFQETGLWMSVTTIEGRKKSTSRPSLEGEHNEK